MIELERVVKSANKSSISIDKLCEIKKYLSTEDKIKFYEEYEKVINAHLEDYPNHKAFIAFIFFNLMAVKYYTNIDLKLNYEEFDTLQSNGLIDKIVEKIGEDYNLLLKLVQMS